MKIMIKQIDIMTFMFLALIAFISCSKDDVTDYQEDKYGVLEVNIDGL